MKQDFFGDLNKIRGYFINVCIPYGAFFPVLFSSHHYPSMAGTLPLSGVSPYLGLVHLSDLLCCRLSVMADDVFGWSVGVVELCSRISDPSNQKANLFGLHSLPLGAKFATTAFSEREVA